MATAQVAAVPIQYKFFPPSVFQPAAFGQSRSDVRGKGLGDKWCAFWSCRFVLHCLRKHPKDFVRMIDGIPEEKRADSTMAALKETVNTLMGQTLD